MKRTGFVLASAAILLLLSALPSAFAQDRDDQDPPARAGRISYTQGSVSFQPGGDGDWLDAVPNRPLTTGDNLWADQNSRAEVQIGSSSIRLGQETSVTILDLGNSVTQLRVSMGSLFFRVRHVGSDDVFEVDTPNLAFNVTEPGEYRVDVNENGDQTTATVWRGDAEITGGGSSYRLSEGQQGTFSGVDQLRYDVAEIGRDDDFSRWCLDRDRRHDRVRSAQYVSDEVTGYEDLDEYGRWHYEPSYGYVWTPVGVAYDWAPYRYGHWVYVAPWGWTWVESEPWGFAPFHYGRWAFVGGGWCWVPGPVRVVPVYSPALVAFVGGGGFHIGVGVGVGWFPLAPGEVFVPWYRTSPHYVQNVNITNTHVTNVQVTNVYNNVTVNKVTNVTYINQRQGRGVTVVNQQTFVNAQPVHNNLIRVNAREVERMPVSHETVRNIQPERQSVFGSAHPVRVAPPPQVMSRPVVATRQPVMVNRMAPVPQAVRREYTPPPVRTVQAAPAAQAQRLGRGASGATPGYRAAPPSASDRPTTPENNRGTAPPFRGQPGSNAPEANAPRPGMNAPRPGGPEGGINRGPQGGFNRGEERGPQNYPANRSNAPEMRPQAPQNNVPAPRPNAPEMNRPAPPENRPVAPENDRPMHNVPRPPSAMPDRGRPQQPMNTQPEPPRSNPSYNRQETPAPQPQTSAPQNNQPRPNYRSAPPQMRDSVPNQPQRQQSAPMPESSRPNSPAQPRHEVAPPPARNEPAPRAPETHSAPPPQAQHESRPAESRGEKGGPPADRGRDNGPQKFR